MPNPSLEPGLIRLFRLFLIVQMTLIAGNVCVHSGRGILDGSPWLALAFGAGGVAALLAYLSASGLRRRLGKYYLPLALIASAVISLVLQNLLLGTRPAVAGGSSEENAWQLFLFLFIPLVLTGWQYGFRAVLAFCLFTTVLDYLLVHFGNPNFSDYQPTYARLLFIRTFSFLFVGYIIAGIVRQMRRQQLDLEQANQRLAGYAATLEQLTVSRERNRLARELHDTLAHTLSGLAVQLEGVRSLWESDPPHAYALLENSLAATRSGLSETRLAIQSLRSEPLENLGILLALQELTRAAAERGGFKVRFEPVTGPLELTEAAEHCLYRVAQEALENVVRHAQAGEVIVRLEKQPACIVLSVCDDGVGFDPAAASAEDRFGLRGMCERAELAGGKLQIDSRPGMGASVRLEIHHD